MSQQMLEPIHARFVGALPEGILREYTCKTCGQRFMATTAHAYKKAGKNGVDDMYCSWTCFSPVEEEAYQKYKRQLLERGAPNYGPKSEKTRQKERYADAKRHLAKWRARLEEPDFASKSQIEQAVIEEKVEFWKREVVIREKAYEEAKGNAGACSVRGVAGGNT